jgi:hypothetical protein
MKCGGAKTESVYVQKGTVVKGFVDQQLEERDRSTLVQDATGKINREPYPGRVSG